MGGKRVQEKKWVLTVTEGQARVLKSALDLYSRVSVGQVEEILHLGTATCPPVVRGSAIGDALEEVKRDMFPELDSPFAFYGIYSEGVRDDARVAWDLYQVIRHSLAWELNPPSCGSSHFGVDYNTPLQSGREKLARIRVTGKKKTQGGDKDE